MPMPDNEVEVTVSDTVVENIYLLLIYDLLRMPEEGIRYDHGRY